MGANHLPDDGRIGRFFNGIVKRLNLTEMGTWLLFWKAAAIVSVAASIFANPGMILFAVVCAIMVNTIQTSKKNGKQEC